MTNKKVSLFLVLGCALGVIYVRGVPSIIKIWPRWETQEQFDNADSDLFHYLLSFEELRILERKGALIRINHIEAFQRDHIWAEEWLEIRLDSQLDFYLNDPIIGHQLFLLAEGHAYSIEDFYSNELQHHYNKQQFDTIPYGEEASLKCAEIPFPLSGFKITTETRCEAIVVYGENMVSKIDISNRQAESRNPLSQEGASKILMEKVKVVDQKIVNFTD